MTSTVTRDHMELDEAIERLGDRRRPRREDMSSEKGDRSSDWDLNTGFSVAREYAQNGWEDKADELNNYMTSIENLVDEHWSTSWDVSGECVDVGAFLDGQPECMLNLHLPKIRSVKLVVNISARCSADAGRLLNRGIAVASAVYALQASGVAVSLVAAEWVNNHSDDIHETMIEINQSNQYIDPARLAFWLGHPAALRRCIFRYNEQQSEKVRDRFGFHKHGGYGQPQDADEERLKKEDCIYVPFPETSDLHLYDSPKKAFKTIRKILKKQGIDLNTTS